VSGVTLDWLPNYVIYPDGRIYSEQSSRFLSEIKGASGGYSQVRVSNGGKAKTLYVHRLVAEAFLGEPNGRQVNHKDGNKQNNSVENLEWCTAQENRKHAQETGLAAKGEDFSSAKLTDKCVMEIKERLMRGETYRSIGDKFGVSATIIHRIKHGEAWVHVNSPAAWAFGAKAGMKRGIS